MTWMVPYWLIPFAIAVGITVTTIAWWKRFREIADKVTDLQARCDDLSGRLEAAKEVILQMSTEQPPVVARSVQVPAVYMMRGPNRML